MLDLLSEGPRVARAVAEERAHRQLHDHRLPADREVSEMPLVAAVDAPRRRPAARTRRRRAHHVRGERYYSQTPFDTLYLHERQMRQQQINSL